MSPIYPTPRLPSHLLRRAALPQPQQRLTTRALSTTPCTSIDSYPNALPRGQRTRPPPPNLNPSSANPQQTSPPRLAPQTDKIKGSIKALGDVIRNSLGRTSKPRGQFSQLTTAEALERTAHLKRMGASQSRNWRPGDIYAPHDLSAAEMAKLKRRGPQAATTTTIRTDPFKALNANPMEFYKNYSVMAEFCGPGMRILSRFESGLGNVNQRRYAKAVRRAVGMGLMPSVHRHPEVIEAERRRAEERVWGVDGRSGVMNRV